MRVGKHIIKHHMFDVFRFDDSPDWGLKQFCTIDKLANDSRLQKIVCFATFMRAFSYLRI
jgi:hypothetical protein